MLPANWCMCIPACRPRTSDHWRLTDYIRLKLRVARVKIQAVIKKSKILLTSNHISKKFDRIYVSSEQIRKIFRKSLSTSAKFQDKWSASRPCLVCCCLCVTPRSDVCMQVYILSPPKKKKNLTFKNFRKLNSYAASVWNCTGPLYSRESSQKHIPYFCKSVLLASQWGTLAKSGCTSRPLNWCAFFASSKKTANGSRKH